MPLYEHSEAQRTRTGNLLFGNGSAWTRCWIARLLVTSDRGSKVIGSSTLAVALRKLREAG